MGRVDEGLTITEVAQRTGLSPQTLRSYERSGLLGSTKRGANGKRRYSEQELTRIRLLARLRATGMSPAQVRKYAELARTEKGTEARRLAVLTAHRQQVLARIAQLHEDLALIEYQIQQLQRHQHHSDSPPRKSS